MAGTILYLENVTVSFDGFKAVDSLNTYVKYGELRFLIGPNGAGKTTLLDVICGKVKPATGRVVFKEDIDIGSKQEYEIVQLGIGRKFQAPSVFGNLTVFENLELAIQKERGIWASLFGKLTSEQRDKIFAILETIGQLEKAHEKAETLSHGEKQWLEIGMLLVQEPEMLLLDEPVAGMTKKETEKTGELLRAIAKDRSVLVVEHDMEFVRNFAEKVTVMHEGKILCEGSMEQVQSDPRVVEVYLGRGGDSHA
ncbi:urea ABC transporter, ATP-binding protein UrtD [Desulfotomaculum nigrificans CO-1-SRB]|uniref:Urea ABC transporter, ATP-binding protein UrtD n=1 Tax=Desulfotomaculum nigrificans (strain DSM 14880 / VKM B-2319 / CO-1-SRB) TaxID=868595 RepID=F6B8X5_DESCC|nr:urea ABC transporter ATP-binding protein UrtD [Desulfotomaculum nigrificans]AEF93626.1 urea ABC transporter, ATP-binding protein UrtD [Desulfotomaculum nigrificans CO-1-SRB]